MPIKLPKGFSRRKSSGNVLDEVENAPTQSFRVLERPNGASKSFDSGSKLGIFNGIRGPGPRIKPTGESREEEDKVNSNRGSGGSNTNSASTGEYHDNASSTRLSSSSTVPSSVDAQNLDMPYHARPQKSSYGVPLPPVPDSSPAFSLRAGGRTFSFGSKAPRPPNAPPGKYSSGAAPPTPSEEPEGTYRRDRAMTESSHASTTTPPQLDTFLDSSDLSGFSNIFDGIGKRRSALIDGSASGNQQPTSPTSLAKSYAKARSNLATPSPLQIRRGEDIESSPYSWGSHDSADGLMSSPSPPARAYTLEDTPPVPSHGYFRPLASSNTAPEYDHSGARERRLAQPVAVASSGPRASNAFLNGRSSIPVNDGAVQLVFDSVNASRALSQDPPLPSPKKVGEDGRHRPAALFDSDDPELFGNLPRNVDSNETTPRARKAEPARSYGSHNLDSSTNLLSGTLNESSAAQRSPRQKKVMTPAEFEQYRRQKELSSTMGYKSGSDDSDDGDTYDDSDELERNRQQAKQRRKQEAHLTVYRQQMMKVTGEQPSELPRLGQPRPGLGERSSASAPNLLGEISTLNVGDAKATPSTRNSDDEDDDVPLGILAAHGFPNKNRPPTRLSAQTSNPNLRSSSQMSSYPPPPASTAGEPGSGGRSSTLPPFARHLPQDPYLGASLVNPSNREPLAFGHNNAGSVHGGGHSNVPPGGLVGVIAGEERARAMRRGSPNAQGNYGTSGASPSNPHGMMPSLPPQLQYPGSGPHLKMPGLNGMPPMGMPMGMPVMSAGDQAQIQMSQQMTEMMQMQMQWMQQMQQMMQMQGGQAAPQPPQHQQMNNNLAPGSPSARPSSMGPISGPGVGPPQMHQRTMSMLDPMTPQWNPGSSRQSQYIPSFQPPGQGQPNYAPSIAPSERSNVGQPSRYRPVSTVAPTADRASRASTFTSGTLQSWAGKQGASASIRPIDRPSTGASHSDDDDDEGWEEMKKKRESKKSSWKIKRDTHGFKDMLFSKD